MLRVASIPSAHPYVASVLPTLLPVDHPSVAWAEPAPVELSPDEDPRRTPEGHPRPSVASRTRRATGDAPRAAAGRLPDPLPDGRAPQEGVWWPPRWLDTAWVDAHAAEADLVHLHFGFEGSSTDQLRAWSAALHRRGLPLVLTVHDLANPHLVDQAPHEAALDVLVPAAAAVLTLTGAAAAVIRDRWGVDAEVLPHLQVVPDAELLAADGARRPGPPVVGVHLGALRANADPRPWLPALADAARARGGRVEVVVNDEVERGDDPARRALLAEVRALLDGRRDAVVRVLPRMDDPTLHAWVGGLDVAALPYRHGTHSGWLEMCWDLGTSVLAPPVGCYADQHDDPGFLARLTSQEAADSLGTLLDARAAAPGPCPWGEGATRLAARRATAARVRRAHERVYARVTREAAPPGGTTTPEGTAGATR